MTELLADEGGEGFEQSQNSGAEVHGIGSLFEGLTRSEIEAELRGLEHLLREHGRLPVERSDPFLLRARASMLYDFYTGVERILIKIAEESGGGIPRSEQWHRDLLRSMTMELPDLRPAAISRELHDLLMPYLRFRHFFRTVYGYVLDESRLDELDGGFDPALT